MGGKLKAIVCGGSPLPAYLDRYFAALGVKILDGYGLTEASPIVSMRSEKIPVLGTVGKPLPSTEIRILGEKGESLPPGPQGKRLREGTAGHARVLQGPAGNAAAPLRGRLAGDRDSGILTIDGNLVITGRMKHAIVMRFGERVEPEPIEMVIQESPYVQEAVLVGDSRDALGLLIVPNMDSLRRLADSRKIEWTDPKEIVTIPPSIASIRKRCSRCW